jgi:hypothetical protein
VAARGFIYGMERITVGFKKRFSAILPLNFFLQGDVVE